MSRLKHIIMSVTTESFRAFFIVLLVEIRVLACGVFKHLQLEFCSYNFAFVLFLNMQHYFFLLAIILGDTFVKLDQV